MLTMCLFHTSGSFWKTANEFGTYIFQGASKGLPCKIEEKGQEVESLLKRRSQLIGKFLSDPTNKEALFEFLSNILATYCPPDKEVFITSGARVLSRGTDHMPTTINYEKADTRILVHLKDALENSSTTCLVRTVDKDVVLFSFHHLLSLSPTQMYEHLLAHGKAFLLQYHQCNIPCSRKSQIVGFTHVPQLQRMWYSVCILRQRQTTRMASLEIFF